jgi:hypothetical protein
MYNEVVNKYSNYNDTMIIIYTLIVLMKESKNNQFATATIQIWWVVRTAKREKSHFSNDYKWSNSASINYH